MWAQLSRQTLARVNSRAFSRSIPCLTSETSGTTSGTSLTKTEEPESGSGKPIMHLEPEPMELPQEMKDENYPQIGNRDIVAPGFSYGYDYFDEEDVPFPSVRFRANTADVLALREKELGDWKALTLEEKKQLYRNSFEQTFAEMKAPTGCFKRILIHCFYIMAFTSIYQTYTAFWYFNEDCMPRSVEINTNKIIKKKIAINTNPLTGASRTYDYENNEWKK